MVRVTKTTNKIHFSDLDPLRFEDFCTSLIYPIHPWKEIRSYGKSGNDDGIDIYAIEQIENNSERVWFVQCKRYSRFSKSQLKIVIDDVIKNNKKLPDIFLLIITCDISKKAYEFFKSYTIENGINNSIIWTSSYLEARLYNERPDLLFTYFGISRVSEQRQKEIVITRNIALKKKFRKDFFKDKLNREEIWNDPSKKFKYHSVIIHSIDDSIYPNIDDNGVGISGWFKLELYNLYFNGIEFVLTVDTAIIDHEGNWSVIGYYDDFDKNKYEKINLLRIGRVPYRCIVDYDLLGDEYYSEPHIYCRFMFGGEPYESFKWVTIDTDYAIYMKEELKFDYKAKIKG